MPDWVKIKTILVLTSFAQSYKLLILLCNMLLQSERASRRPQADLAARMKFRAGSLDKR